MLDISVVLVALFIFLGGFFSGRYYQDNIWKEWLFKNNVEEDK